MNRPYIDVVVPAYNAEAWIAETIRSIALQPKGLIRSIMVIDDASEDKTTSVAKAALADIPRAYIWTNLQRVGALENVKTFHDELMVRQAQFPEEAGVTMRVDGDDFLMPEAAERVVEAYEKPKTVATYGGAVAFPSGHIFPIIRHEGNFAWRWMFSNLMTWRQDIWWAARERYPQCFDTNAWKEIPGGNPASDVAYYAPIVKCALDSGMTVRPTYGPIYAWRSHPLNEQARRRPEQVLAERAVFDAIRRTDSVRAAGKTA